MAVLVLTTVVLVVWLVLRLVAMVRFLGRGPRPQEPDPFEVLRVQSRLGAIADEIRAVEADPKIYAKAHRLTALRAAYDDLLAEACDLADVPVGPGRRRGDGVRWHAEQELAARGWSW